MSELNKSINTRLKTIFENLFESRFELTDKLTADEVKGWDSIAHVKLILAVEEEFKIRFKLQEVSALKNLGDLKSSIEKKVSALVK